MNDYCDSNATACSACSGNWTDGTNLGLGSSLTTPTPALRTQAPSRGGDLFDGNTPPPVASTSSRVPAPTRAPTYPPTHPPTSITSFPPVSATASGQQACLEASKDARAVTKLLQGSPGETVTLERSATQLCTLWQVNAARTTIIPVGRSYHGHPWEPYGGKLNWVKFQCNQERCTLTLPELPDGFSYELAGFDYELPKRDEIARFLEQPTFGPTRKEINALQDTPFAEWISKQQNNVPLSSHRKFFRERATALTPGRPSKMGISTQPCQAGARYRSYSFSPIDRFQELEIRTDPGTGRKILLREGQAMTVLEATSLTVQQRGNNAVPVALQDGL